MKHFAVAAGDLFADFGPQLQTGPHNGGAQNHERDPDQSPYKSARAEEQLFDLRDLIHSVSHRALRRNTP